jgi:hypothetical protein
VNLMRVESAQTGLSALTSRDAARASDQRIFASVLSKARQDAPLDPVQAATEGAENLISVALVQPVISKMRESTWAAEPFKPTSGEKSFRGMLDNAFALKLVRSGNWALVEKVKERMLERVKAGGGGEVQQAIAEGAELRGEPRRGGLGDGVGAR